MEENNNKLETMAMPRYIKYFGIFILILLVAILSLYFNHFSRQLGDNSDFGAFGDYVGGIFNPILSFFTIFLLIWSIKTQVEELKLTREELGKSASALQSTLNNHEASLELQKNEIIRKQVQDHFEHHWASCDDLYNSPFIKGRRGTEGSLNQVLSGDLSPEGNPIVNVFIESIPKRMEGFLAEDYRSYQLKSIRDEVNSICFAVQELFKYLDSPVVRKSIYSRVDYLLAKTHNLQIINDNDLSVLSNMIKLPEELDESVLRS